MDRAPKASAQAMAVAIRGIALGEVDRQLLKHVLKRELIVGLLSGLCIGVSAAVIAMIFHHRHGWRLGLLAGGALLVNHSLACVWGVTVPFVHLGAIFRRRLGRSVLPA